ncbi:MAG TPA: hypothetical protein VLR90_20635 [Blastocatellia bacterium]|nr:hypothetical protein [Blastocatellia bacterium]
MKMMASADINSLKDILRPMNQSGEFKSEISAMAFLAGLDLTENQRKEIRHILDDELPYIELLESQLIKNCRQLQLAARTLLFSKGQLELLLIQRARIQKEILASRQQLKIRILDELTPDQRAVLEI